MKIRVVYHSSKSGNTEKLAKAVAEELNVKALPSARRTKAIRMRWIYRMSGRSHGESLL